MSVSSPWVSLVPEGRVKGSATLVSAWLRQCDERSQPMAARLPLGLLHLSTAAQRAGFAVEIRDVQLLDNGTGDDTSPALMTRVLQGAGPVVGISCMSDLLPAVVLAVEAFKKAYPDAFVVLGGPGPSGLAEALLREFPCVDAVVQGEGERSWVELLDALHTHRPLRDVAGLFFRTARTVEQTPPRARITDLDGLPPLPYEVLPLHRYSPTLPVLTSRGCPYPCSFCDVAHLWGHRTTWHSIAGVLKTLKRLVVLGAERVTFVDDTFVLDRKRVLGLCRDFARDSLGLRWHCNGRINLMDESLLQAMADGGCVSIFYGLESGARSTLRRIRKGFAPEDAFRVALTSARYMQVTTSFIWGFPDETWQDFQETRELYWRLREEVRVNVQIYQLTPYPGTPVYLRHGREVVFDPTIRSHVRHLRLLTPQEQTLIRQYPKLFPSFYHFPTPHLIDKLAQVEEDRRVLSS